MFREIKVGDKIVPMLANGATALRYRHVFKRDIIKELSEAQEDMSKGVNSIPELAFIMAMAAKAKDGEVDMNLLNEEKYIEWLEDFGPMDLPMAAEEITNLYAGNSITDSEPKKKGRGGVKDN